MSCRSGRPAGYEVMRKERKATFCQQRAKTVAYFLFLLPYSMTSLSGPFQHSFADSFTPSTRVFGRGELRPDGVFGPVFCRPETTDAFCARVPVISLDFRCKKRVVASAKMHDVDGIECREVTVDVATIGKVTVLEATADAQENLVEEAIRLEEDETSSTNTAVGIDVGDVYGSVLWPSASAVANYILAERSSDNLSGKTILELGCGSGLVSIALSRGGAAEVIATDYESFPLKLLRYAESNLNPISQPCGVRTDMLDICNFDAPLPESDLVVAADVMYESTTGRAMAHRTVEALRRGSRVVIGCSPGRPGRPAFLEELKRLEPGIKADFDRADGFTRAAQPQAGDCGACEAEPVSVYLMDLDPKSLLHPA